MFKHKKSIVLIISAIVLVFILSACKNKTENTIGKAADNKNVVEEQTKPAPNEEKESSDQEKETAAEKVVDESEVKDDSNQEEEKELPDEPEENPAEEATEGSAEDKTENTTGNDTVPEGEKEVKTENKSRDDSFYVEAVVDNFSKLYPSVVNRGDAKLDVLDTVIIKDSKFYKEIKAEVQKLKKNKTKIEFEEFYIEGIKKETDDTYKVTVTQTLRKTADGTVKTVQENVYYKVAVKDNKVGIVEKTK
jgi:hypothetical protein